ncbi:hypothetical protein ACLOJK_029163 [Asimina triloba]
MDAPEQLHVTTVRKLLMIQGKGEEDLQIPSTHRRDDRDVEDVATVVDFGEGELMLSGHHEELPNGGDTRLLKSVHDRAFLFEELFHEVCEVELDLVVCVEVELEERGVVLDEASNLAAAGTGGGGSRAHDGAGRRHRRGGHTRVGGEEGFCPGDEAEDNIVLDDLLEGLDAVGFVLDELDVWGFGADSNAKGKWGWVWH